MTKVTVLGINGHFGIAAVRAFADAGYEVIGFGRSNKHPDPRMTFIKGDAERVEDMRAAIGDSEIVVNALNLRYDQWGDGRKENQIARVIEALGTTGKTLMFPASIYNYAATERTVTPQSPQSPEMPRGAIHVRAEAMMRAAAERGDIQTIIVRAGDFFGPACTGEWYEQAILREAGKGRVALMGKPHVGHSWAYLPDLTRAFVTLAGMRKTLAQYELFHFAGNYVTSEAIAAAVQRAAPVPLKAVRFPWLAMTLMGLANPVIRDVARMRYLWENPMELSDKRLTAILGPTFGTPFDDAVAQTIVRYFPALQQAA